MAAGADAALAQGVAELLKLGIRSHALDEILALVRRKVEENRDTATELVQDRSRWWIASTIDRRVAALAVDGVLSLLAELGTEGSELRLGFEKTFDDAVDSLEREGTLARSIGEGRRALAHSGAFDRLALRFAETLRDRLAARIDADPDAVAAPVAALIRDLATRLRADPAAQAALDARIAALAAQVIGDLRPMLGGYVADVIAGWEPERDDRAVRGRARPRPAVHPRQRRHPRRADRRGPLRHQRRSSGEPEPRRLPLAFAARRPYIDRRRTRV